MGRGALLRVAALVLGLVAVAQAFQPLAPRPLSTATRARAWTMPAGAKPRAPPTTMLAVDPSSIVAGVGATTTMLADNAWVGPAKAIIEPVLDLGGVAFLVRIILSWYPQIDLNKLPVNLIAWPTEPFLKATRVVVPPAFGVDISPIIWFAFLNFLREILISDQGILTILQQKG